MNNRLCLSPHPYILIYIYIYKHEVSVRATFNQKQLHIS